MPAVRIGPKHQVTIPKEVFTNLQLKVGDFLEAAAQGGKLVLSPLQVSVKAPAPRLSPAEQRLLARAQTKVERIQRNLRQAKGLTAAEAKVAAKAGLIDADQAYWWTEAWQKGERESEADLERGDVIGPVATVPELKAALARHRKARV